MDRARACALSALALACVGQSVVPVREVHDPEPLDDVEPAVEPGVEPSDAAASAPTHHLEVASARLYPVGSSRSTWASAIA
jgi:hypothetical protein